MTRNLRPRLFVGLLVILAGVLIACSGGPDNDEQGRIHVLTWDGPVNQVMARYIERGIGNAEDANATAVVLRLDTPGGADSAMRDIIQRMEASTVPVIVYVSPAGGRAASAGTFITMAGQVAAMAPNTSIGAATPIDSNGNDIPGALGRKVTNDAVSYIRGIAELRGRNADWAESAVRDAVSTNENGAVNLDVVDYVATNMDDLLAQADERIVQVPSATGVVENVTLRTKGVATVDDNTNIFEDLLDVIADPNIAFVLLLAGGMLILSEIVHPSFVAGIAGAICLILAYFALGALPTNWAAVGLIGLGLLLLATEVFVPGFGVFGIGGLVALAIGGFFLMGSSDAGLEVSRWLLFALIAVVGAFFMIVLAALLKMRRMAAAPSQSTNLVGGKGMTRTRLDPTGIVWIGGERWEATAVDAPLPEETPVIVTQMEGLHLRVKRDPASIKLLPPTAVAARE